MVFWMFVVGISLLAFCGLLAEDSQPKGWLIFGQNNKFKIHCD